MTTLLGLLLYLCPPSFRRDYGREVVALFAARRSRLGADHLAIAALEVRTAWDIVKTAAIEWRDRLQPSRRTPAQVAATEHRRMSMADRLIQDLRDAVRRLAGAPGFTVSAALILATGIGGTTAIFSAVDAFVFRPRPFAQPHELVNIYQDSDDGRPSSNSYPAYLDIAARTDLFSGVGTVMPEGSATMLTGSGDAEVVQVEYASSSYFPVLGLRPIVGRWFDASEDQSGGPVSAVLSYSTWMRRFGGDPEILERSIRLSGTSVTIVGIGPPEHTGFVPGLSTGFWLSISALGPVGGPFRGRTLTRREDHWFQIVARLKPDRTTAEAQAAMTILAEHFGREYTETDRNRRITVIRSDRIRIHPDVDEVLYAGAAAPLVLAALVLLVVCSNLANVVLARGAARSREFAVRLALGATRVQIARGFLLENLLLALVGGTAGMLLARWIVSALSTIELPIVLSADTTFAIDGRVVAFGVLLSLLTGLAFGLFPALRATRRDLVPALKGSGPTPGWSRLWRIRSASGLLVTVQVAVSLALLAGGGILLRSVIAASRLDPGFGADDIAIVTIDPGRAGRRGPEGLATVSELLARARAYPGVQSAAIASRIPLTPFGNSSTLVLDETAVTRTDDRTAEVSFATITPEYFALLGIPILHGRGFTEADQSASEPVAIVSEAMARQYWHARDVVGRRFKYQSGPDAWVRIVGVAGNVAVRTLGETPAPFAYRPFGQTGAVRPTLLVRAELQPAEILRWIRADVRAVDPLIPVLAAGLLSDHVERSQAVPRAAMQAFVGFGALAVGLACFGIYAVVAFNVSRRTSEMGVRMAVGATASEVTRLVVREMMSMVIAGIVLGLGLAALISPALASLLVGIGPNDPATFGVVSAIVLTVALVATWLPARRAGRADLSAVLRAE